MNNTSIKPLLSIIIASKNREYYCIEAIKSILAIASNELQLAIADNSDSEKVKDFVATLSDSRLVYQYDNSPTSSIDNFNKCMSLATGEYVCMVGDDDSVLPTIIDTVRWAKTNGIDSFCSKRTIIYYWPNSRAIYPNGFLELPYSTNKKTEINTKKELVSLLKNGLQHYLTYSLPKTYHGVVKRELMLEIKQKTGHFYGALSPDIYSAVSLSLYAKKHYEIEQPTTIAGVCATSTTAENFTGKHSGKLETMPHLRNRGPYVWSKLIPEYYSVNTIWAESGIKALEEIDKVNLIDRYFNKYRMLAQGYINNRQFIGSFVIEKTLEYKKDHCINSLVFYPKLAWSVFLIVSKKAYTLLIRSKKEKQLEIGGVQNIHGAISEALKFYKY